MKNKMSDVRDHLVMLLEKLNDPDETKDKDIVDRAKAAALVADKYIASVKTELDARKLYADYGERLSAMDAVPAALPGSERRG